MNVASMLRFQFDAVTFRLAVLIEPESPCGSCVHPHPDSGPLGPR